MVNEPTALAALTPSCEITLASRLVVSEDGSCNPGAATGPGDLFEQGCVAPYGLSPKHSSSVSALADYWPFAISPYPAGLN
jgi:hypothetical protein